MLGWRRFRHGPITVPTPWPFWIGCGATILTIELGADLALLFRGHLLSERVVKILGLAVAIPLLAASWFLMRRWKQTVWNQFAVATAAAIVVGAAPIAVVAIDGLREERPSASCVRLKGWERLDVIGGPYRLEVIGIGPVTLATRREKPLESSDDAVAWTTRGLLGLRRVVAIERLVDVLPDDPGDCHDARKVFAVAPPTGRR